MNTSFGSRDDKSVFIFRTIGLRQAKDLLHLRSLHFVQMISHNFLHFLETLSLLLFKLSCLVTF